MVKLAKSLLTKQIKLSEDESNYKEEAEIAARESYSKKSGNLVQTTGFWCQKEFAWLGARPDGIVIDIKLEQRGLLAIECPYSARSMTIQQYSKQSDMCMFVHLVVTHLKKAIGGVFFIFMLLALKINLPLE